MSHSVKFPFTPKLSAALDTVRDGAGTDNVLVLKINGESVDLDSTSADASSWKANDAKAPYFLLLRNPVMEAKWGLLSYVPDTCPPKERMHSASCFAHIKKECGLNVYKETRVNDEEDVVPGIKGIHDAPVVAVRETPSEQMAENMAPRPMAGMSHGLAISFSESVVTAVKSLVAKETKSLTLRMEKETIVVEASGMNETTPSFHVGYSEGGEVMMCFFLCPSGCKVRERMVCASSKSSVVDQLQALGCVFDKCHECGEIADVAEALGGGKKGPAALPAEATAPVAPARPKRPGKGPAMLIE